MDQYLNVVTRPGSFQFRVTDSKKPACPSFGTDAYACGTGCPNVSICYARHLQRIYTRTDRRWKENQRVMDALKPRELDQLFTHGMQWTMAVGYEYFRGWVSGDGSAEQIQALARAAEQHKVWCWIPSSRYGQEVLGFDAQYTVVRGSRNQGPYTSAVFTGVVHKDYRECTEECLIKCDACWDKSIKKVGYHLRPYTKRRR